MPRLDQFREQRAVDHFGPNLGIQQGELVQCLDHVRAVVAAEADDDLEIKLVVDGLDDRTQAGVEPRRRTGSLQHGQNE